LLDIFILLLTPERSETELKWNSVPKVRITRGSRDHAIVSSTELTAFWIRVNDEGEGAFMSFEVGKAPSVYSATDEDERYEEMKTLADRLLWLKRCVQGLCSSSPIGKKVVFELVCDEVPWQEIGDNFIVGDKWNVDVRISRNGPEQELMSLKNVLLTARYDPWDRKLVELSLTKEVDLSLPTYYAR
jgi:hypothetical protein